MIHESILSITWNAFNCSHFRNVNVNRQINNINNWFKLNKLSIDPFHSLLPVVFFFTDSAFIQQSERLSYVTCLNNFLECSTRQYDANWRRLNYLTSMNFSSLKSENLIEVLMRQGPGSEPPWFCNQDS